MGDNHCLGPRGRTRSKQFALYTGDLHHRWTERFAEIGSIEQVKSRSDATREYDNGFVPAAPCFLDLVAMVSPWFAELGARSAAMLNTAGLVFCPGGVMAKNPGCRHGLAGWKHEIDRWIDERQPIDLLNADIFYDFRPVEGDRRLAEDLRAYAAAAAKAPGFLMRLAHMLDASSPALSPVFGRFRVKSGRVDLKRGGLRSLVAAARILALRVGAPALSTAGRLAAATEAGLLVPDDLALFRDAAERLLRHILEQQLVDIEAGRPPGSAVEIRRLPRIRRERRRAALLAVGRIDLVVRDALGR